MSDPDPKQEPTPAAPPTVAAPLAPPQRRSAWPGIVGIIAIVFGSLAVLGGVWSFVSLAFLPQLLELMTRGAQLETLPTAMMQGSAIFQGIVSLSLGTLLLFAGIALRRRQKRGMRLGKIWAIVKIPVVVIGTWLAMPIQQANIDAMTQSPGGPPPALLSTFMWLGLSIGLLWASALPVFMLIWFSRRKIKTETATWP